MIPLKLLKKYGKKAEYTYTLGPFPTFELLNSRPELLEEVIVHSQITPEMEEKAKTVCQRYGIPMLQSDKTLEKIREKETCMMAGVLKKYQDTIDFSKNHVVLVNPSDMGNLGTIIRTCVGFGIQDIALVEPCADQFHPKTIRASMGALFSIRFERFPSFEEYLQNGGESRDYYPFMLTGSVSLSMLKRDPARLYSLIFGNESSGLPDSFSQLGQPVRIKHTEKIDSLNLSMAAGIALYDFTKNDFSE